MFGHFDFFPVGNRSNASFQGQVSQNAYYDTNRLGLISGSSGIGAKIHKEWVILLSIVLQVLDVIEKRIATESQIGLSPNFPMIAYSQRSTEEFVSAEKRRMKIFWRKCFIWVTKLGPIHGEVLPSCFLPKHNRPSNGDLPSNNRTQNCLKPTPC